MVELSRDSEAVPVIFIFTACDVDWGQFGRSPSFIRDSANTVSAYPHISFGFLSLFITYVGTNGL